MLDLNSNYKYLNTWTPWIKNSSVAKKEGLTKQNGRAPHNAKC